MAWNFVDLPLYEEYDYNYTVSLEGEAYNLRIYFNQRMGLWFLDLSRDNGEVIVEGVGLHKYYPILNENKIPELSGFMWLQPTGDGLDESLLHPDLIAKYYKLYYLWEVAE